MLVGVVENGSRTAGRSLHERDFATLATDAGGGVNELQN